MLDIKYVTENIEEVIKRLNTRNDDFSYLRQIIDLSDKRKSLIRDVEELKSIRNENSKLIGELKRRKEDTSSIMKNISDFGENIKKLDQELKDVEDKIQDILSITPNIPNKDIPIGITDADNLEVKKVGEPTKFSFEPKDHVWLSEKLGILDFERATKITGARFVVNMGLGARLERSLIQFMMDTHCFNHGYKEVLLPYIVNEKTMYSSGQFPKFKDEVFKIQNVDGWYLNPTAEVPTINLYRDEILKYDELPLKYCAFTTAFRAEAGSAGRDTRGILRQHQFNKVELIKFTAPEDSYKELDLMLENSEKILKLLNIPYRVVTLCTGDLGFAMAKTYDIEVWLPGQNTYREIASISNAEDFQARRANIRFKRDKDSKTEYVHTLNGSGLAVGRTLIAILENYQNEDGSIRIPDVLIPYMKTDIIK